MYTRNLQYLIIVFLSFASLTVVNGNSFEKNEEGSTSIFTTILHKQADKKFDGLAYAEAIEKYEKLISKGFSPASVLRNLAVSYFKINNPQKAEETFRQLIDNNEATPEDIYYYAQSLKYNEKYAEADKWILRYTELNKNDSRGKKQLESARFARELRRSEDYVLTPVYFNTKYPDFGAVELDSQIIFTSGRPDRTVVQLIYPWKGDPYLDIFSAPKEEDSSKKNIRLLSKGINSRYHDGPICYSPDGKEVYVTRNNFQNGMPKIGEDDENHFMLYYAKRVGAEWEELKELPFNSKDFSCGHPAISPDNTTLYFASDMPGGFGGSDIYYVKRQDTTWSKPVNLGSDINTEGEEMFPFMDEDGYLYFASNGLLGIGGLDIFMAAEYTPGNYAVINMGYPLNSSYDDFSFYLQDKGPNGYMASNRAGGAGDDDIYRFEIINKPYPLLKLIGTTKNSEDSTILPNTAVNVFDDDEIKMLDTISNENGNFEMLVPPDIYLDIKASKDSFERKEEQIFVDKNKFEGSTYYVDIFLDEIKEWGVYGLVYEKPSLKGVKDVKISIIATNGTQKVTKITDKQGKFRQLLLPETDYDIVFKKEGFFTKYAKITTKDMEPGWINIEEYIEANMEEIVIGKSIEVPNIYYDLDKWNIRPDAAKELDKIVEFMKDYENISLELSSHTDARGSNSYNQVLSQKRAESAVTYIVNHGIDRSRITAKGYGETKLKNRCADGVKCSEEEHQKNRRTEITVLDY